MMLNALRWCGNCEGHGQGAAGIRPPTRPYRSATLRVRFAVPLNGEGVWKVRMNREPEKSLDERRRIVDYLDGLYPGGHL